MEDRVRVFCVVDMQNDFVTGALANKDAEAIVPDMVKYLKDNYVPGKDILIFTRDTHNNGMYDTSNEGRYLPVRHCIADTEGWEVIDELKQFIPENPETYYLNKIAFGADTSEWISALTMAYVTQIQKLCAPDYDEDGNPTDEDDINKFVDAVNSFTPGVISEVIIMGTCTDICVVSNALALKTVLAAYENTDVKVVEHLCAGLSKEKHNAAIETMSSCQCEII